MVQAQGYIGIFRRIGCGLFQLDLVEGQLLFTLARNGFKAGGAHAQVTICQRIHVMTAGCGVEYIGLQHGIGADALQLDAVVTQHVHVVFDVLADLFQLGIFQQRLQLRQHRIPIQLCRRTHIVMRQRHIGGLARLNREGNPHQFCFHIVQAGGFGIEGKLTGRFQLFQPGIQSVLRQYGFIFGFDAVFSLNRLIGTQLSGITGFELTYPALELELFEQLQQLLRVGFGQGDVVQVDMQGYIGLDGGQQIGQLCRFAVVFQLFRHGLGATESQLGDFIQIFIQILDAADTLQQRQRRLFTHTGHTGNVVHLVPLQRQQVDHQMRRHAELFLDPGHIHLAVVHGVDQGDMLIHQLRHILVTGGDDHRAAGLAGLTRQGADDVIRFDAFLNEQRQSHGTDDGVDRLHLSAQIIRHGRAV